MMITDNRGSLLFGFRLEDVRFRSRGLASHFVTWLVTAKLGIMEPETSCYTRLSCTRPHVSCLYLAQKARLFKTIEAST